MRATDTADAHRWVGEQVVKRDHYVCDSGSTPLVERIEYRAYIPYSITILFSMCKSDHHPTHQPMDMSAMQHPVPLCLLAIASIVPMRAFAQDTEYLTRAQVREELADLEQRGYNPGDWAHYPQNLRIAQTRAAPATNEPSHDNRPVQLQQLRAE